ncbi:MAG TPA: hypothetical protein VG367_15595 [Mucilaginibacter sp.]|jgi:hypothetical protein|nr:hypothetical protein [Mucilaginibacter sp.]
MKNLALFCIAACIGLFSCQKSSTDPKPVAVQADSHLVGDWKLVSDSTSSYSQALGTHGDKYMGTSADRFVFASDGKLSLNEGTTVESGTFTMNSDGSLQLQYTSRYQDGMTIMGSADYFATVSIDAHSATLSNEGWAPAGVYFVRVVKLSR